MRLVRRVFPTRPRGFHAPSTTARETTLQWRIRITSSTSVRCLFKSLAHQRATCLPNETAWPCPIASARACSVTASASYGASTIRVAGTGLSARKNRPQRLVHVCQNIAIPMAFDPSLRRVIFWRATSACGSRSLPQTHVVDLIVRGQRLTKISQPLSTVHCGLPWVEASCTLRIAAIRTAIAILRIAIGPSPPCGQVNVEHDVAGLLWDLPAQHGA